MAETSKTSEAIRTLTARIDAMQAEIERLTALTRHIAPECPECGLHAYRVALHDEWIEAHAAECSRGKRITRP